MSFTCPPVRVLPAGSGRTRRGWRQVDLAERLGWSQTRVAAAESGRRTLDITAIVELCRAFDVPLSKLLEDAEPEDRQALGLPS